MEFKKEIVYVKWKICRYAQRPCLQMHWIKINILQYFQNVRCMILDKCRPERKEPDEPLIKPVPSCVWESCSRIVESSHQPCSGLSVPVLNKKAETETLYDLFKLTRLAPGAESTLTLWLLFSAVNNTETTQRTSESCAALACQLSASNLRTAQPCKEPRRQHSFQFFSRETGGFYTSIIKAARSIWTKEWMCKHLYEIWHDTGFFLFIFSLTKV